jgi:hypothetical protein
MHGGPSPSIPVTIVRFESHIWLEGKFDLRSSGVTGRMQENRRDTFGAREAGGLAEDATLQSGVL